MIWLPSVYIMLGEMLLGQVCTLAAFSVHHVEGYDVGASMHYHCLAELEIILPRQRKLQLYMWTEVLFINMAAISVHHRYELSLIG